MAIQGTGCDQCGLLEQGKINAYFFLRRTSSKSTHAIDHTSSFVGSVTCLVNASGAIKPSEPWPSVTFVKATLQHISKSGQSGYVGQITGFKLILVQDEQAQTEARSPSERPTDEANAVNRRTLRILTIWGVVHKNILRLHISVGDSTFVKAGERIHNRPDHV